MVGVFFLVGLLKQPQSNKIAVWWRLVEKLSGPGALCLGRDPLRLQWSTVS